MALMFSTLDKPYPAMPNRPSYEALRLLPVALIGDEIELRRHFLSMRGLGASSRESEACSMKKVRQN